MLELRCPKHPTYRGLRKPRVKCDDCKVIYDGSYPDPIELLNYLMDWHRNI